MKQTLHSKRYRMAFRLASRSVPPSDKKPPTPLPVMPCLPLPAAPAPTPAPEAAIAVASEKK